MRLTLGSSQFSEGGSGEMVLRDEKERIRLARLSRSIRKETKCCIYRSKLQTSEGEPEIDDVDVYLGLTSCSRVEACGICLDSECLDRFEEYLTHDEQVEFKHCLISSDSRTFEKYQVEVAKMIREREDMAQRKIEKEIAESKRLEEERRKKEEEEEAELQRLELEAQLKQEEEEKERREQQRERLAVLKLEQKEKISQQQREFTNKELLEIVNNTEEGRPIFAKASPTFFDVSLPLKMFVKVAEDHIIIFITRKINNIFKSFFQRFVRFIFQTLLDTTLGKRRCFWNISPANQTHERFLNFLSLQEYSS